VCFLLFYEEEGDEDDGPIKEGEMGG